MDREEIRRLSEHLIEILKDIAQDGSPLTPNKLASALAHREDLLRVLLPRGEEPQGSKAPAPPLEDSESGTQNMLKSLLMDLVEALPLKLGEPSLTMARLRRRIRQADGPEQLGHLSQELLEAVHALGSAIHRERREVARFVQDIAAGLRDTEEQILASLEDTRRARRRDRVIYQRLDRQVEEIQDSTRFTRTLEELRKAVLSRIQALRNTLEEKRKRDEALTERVNREMEALQESLQQMHQEVQKAQQASRELEQKALLDPLTGIYNRRALQQRLHQEFHRFQRYGQLFSLMLLDVDRFKLVNDQFGHTVGDQCLQELVKLLQPVLRRSDFFARYGGEEFVLILPGTEGQGAHALGERIRSLINASTFSYQQQLIPLTVSIGVTQVDDSDGDPTSVFDRLDRALYEAKNRGRNCVVTL